MEGSLSDADTMTIHIDYKMFENSTPNVVVTEPSSCTISANALSTELETTITLTLDSCTITSYTDFHFTLNNGIINANPTYARKIRISMTSSSDTEATGESISINGHELFVFSKNTDAISCRPSSSNTWKCYDTRGDRIVISGSDHDGDFIFHPISSTINHAVNKMHFSNPGDVVFDQMRCDQNGIGNNCGFVIKPSNGKITTSASNIRSTAYGGLQIETNSGDITLSPGNGGKVYINGDVVFGDSSATLAANWDGNQIASVSSVLRSTANTGLTIDNAGGDIIIQPFSSIFQLDAKTLKFHSTVCDVASGTIETCCGDINFVHLVVVFSCIQ